MAPILTSIQPRWGSALTAVTLTGSGFATTAVDNVVTFNGNRATVTFASETTLVVEPSIEVTQETPAVVAVTVNGTVSAPQAFELVPAGTPGVERSNLPTHVTGVVGFGADLYLTAFATRHPSAGLYRWSPDGRITRVWAAPSTMFPMQGQYVELFDAPAAIATDGQFIYFGTELASILRYDPATGQTETFFNGLDSSLGDGPRYSAIVIDEDGCVFAVDHPHNVLVRISDEGVADLVDPGFPGEIYGLVEASGQLLLGESSGAGCIHRIPDLHAPDPEVFYCEASAGEPVYGLAVVEETVLIAGGETSLWQTDDLANTPMTALVGNQAYATTGLFSPDETNLYLAQPRAHAVRRYDLGDDTVSTVAAGLRIAFGAARVDDLVYISSQGEALFGPGGGEPLSGDGAVLELAADGTSRVVYTGGFPTDLFATETGTLLVSDCLDQRIFELDPTTGAQTDLVTSAEGVLCAAGLHQEADGELFYLHFDLVGGGAASVGHLSATGIHDPAFVSGLEGMYLHLTSVGDDLIISGLAVGDIALPVLTVSKAGGIPEVLVRASTVGGIDALAAAPDGRLFVHRFPLGELLELDPTTGALTHFGNAYTGIGTGGFMDGQIPSAVFALTFLDDGTLVLPDYGQGAIVHVAP